VSSAAERIGTLEAPAPGRPSSSSPVHVPALTVIERRSDWKLLDVQELWRYRELFFLLTWRDVTVRYKQTVLGVAWAVLQPLATMIVFSIFFGRIASAAKTEVPYPLFVFAGLLPWTFFANAIGSAGQSLVGNQNLVTKVYFPRLIIPAGAVGAGLVDLAISFGLMLLLMLYYGVTPGPGLILILPLTLGLVTAALGVGTLLSALTVKYRDFRHAVPFMVQLWMFATPTIYLQAGDLVGPRLRLLLPLNPAYGLISAFRWAALGGPLDAYALVVSLVVSLALLLTGCLYFRRVESGFADVI
jgi:lipopolysaccharide transport system permease protein